MIGFVELQAVRTEAIRLSTGHDVDHGRIHRRDPFANEGPRGDANVLSERAFGNVERGRAEYDALALVRSGDRAERRVAVLDQPSMTYRQIQARSQLDHCRGARSVGVNRFDLRVPRLAPCVTGFRDARCESAAELGTRVELLSIDDHARHGARCRLHETAQRYFVAVALAVPRMSDDHSRSGRCVLRQGACHDIELGDRGRGFLARARQFSQQVDRRRRLDRGALPSGLAAAQIDDRALGTAALPRRVEHEPRAALSCQMEHHFVG